MTMEMTKEQPKETRRVGLALGAIIMSALLLIAFAFSAAPVQAATSSKGIFEKRTVFGVQACLYTSCEWLFR